MKKFRYAVEQFIPSDPQVYDNKPLYNEVMDNSYRDSYENDDFDEYKPDYVDKLPAYFTSAEEVWDWGYLNRYQIHVVSVLTNFFERTFS